MPPIPALSYVAILLGNAVLVVLALAMDWDVHTAARVAWAENGVIGFFAMVKMMSAKEVGLVGRTKPYKAVLFGAHYGTFWAFQTQLLAYLGRGHAVPFAPIAAGLVLALIVHGTTFWKSTWSRGELTRVSSFMFMLLPYARVLPPSLAVVVVVLAELGGLPLGNAAVVAIVVKAGGDCAGHWLEHGWAVERFSREPSPDTSS